MSAVIPATLKDSLFRNSTSSTADAKVNTGRKLQGLCETKTKGNLARVYVFHTLSQGRATNIMIYPWHRLVAVCFYLEFSRL